MVSKIRILHCIPTLGGGGAERQLAYLAGEMAGRGWEVHVAYVRPGPNLERLAQAGVNTHPLGVRSHRSPRLWLQLDRLVRQLRPDILQTWLPLMDLIGGTVARWRRIPWVLSERSAAPAYPASVKSWSRRFLARSAAAVAANSEAGRHYWRDRLPRSVGAHVVPNGLPLKEIDAVSLMDERSSGIPDEGKVLLFAGRLSPERNLDHLLPAMAAALEGEKGMAVLCGDGPQHRQAERWIRQRGLGSRFRLEGYVGEQRLWGWMKRSDALVSASLFEGHPNVVLEAMACACPVVASDIPAHRDILDETCAWLADPRSDEDLTRAIRSVLQQPEEAHRRAEIARERVKGLTVSQMADGYIKIYQGIRRAEVTNETEPGL